MQVLGLPIGCRSLACRLEQLLCMCCSTRTAICALAVRQADKQAHQLGCACLGPGACRLDAAWPLPYTWAIADQYTVDTGELCYAVTVMILVLRRLGHSEPTHRSYWGALIRSSSCNLALCCIGQCTTCELAVQPCRQYSAAVLSAPRLQACQRCGCAMTAPTGGIAG